MKKTLAFLLTFTSLTASATENGFNLLLSGGLTSGGETLAELNTGTKLKAGGLIYLALGTVYQFADSKFQLQASVGYHFDTLDADNGSADFNRTFIELIPFYQITDNIRAGIGITNILSADYSDPLLDLEFDTTTGLVAEIDWRLSKKLWWGIRYTDLEYIITDINGLNVGSGGDDFPIDGSYFGVMLNAGF